MRNGVKAKKTEAGRLAQRNRTRKAIVDATTRLLAEGRTPTMADIVDAAEVSRRTIYMYFPTLEQLLLDATLGGLTQHAIDPVADESEPDVMARVEKLSRRANALAAETMHLGRALIRLTVEGEEPSAGGPRRGYRRIARRDSSVCPCCYARGAFARAAPVGQSQGFPRADSTACGQWQAARRATVARLCRLDRL